jgi:hypothetical protein
MSSAKKTIYYFYHEVVEGYVFVDEEAKFLSWVHDVDPEAFEFIAIHLGGEMIRVFEPYMEFENPSDDLQDTGFVQDEEIQEWLVRSKDVILEAIRQTEADRDLPVIEIEDEEFEQSTIVNHVGPVTDRMIEMESEDPSLVSETETTTRTNKKKEKKKMSTKKTATKKFSAKKTSAKTATKTAKAPSMKKAFSGKKTAAAKKPAKAKPAKKAPPAKKPAKGGGKKKK